MGEPTPYTASDIARYHRGEMTPAEMHLLEKAALDDPALADMLEGYAHTSTAAADLQLLQQKLQQRIEKEKRKPASVFQMPWLRVAALLLLMAGAGWIVLHTFSGRNEIATTNRPKPDVQQKTAPERTDTVAAANQATTMAAEPENTQERRTPVVAKHKATKPASPANTESPLPQANEPAPENEQGYSARSFGLLKAEKQAADSAGTVTAFQRNAPAARPNNDTIKNLNIVMQPVTVPMEEVVIAKRKLPRGAKRISILDTLKPENGWDAFDEYVAENIQSPDELDETPTNQREVELQFSVDKNGNPKNITVTKRLCEKCDTEAIRLLKAGPKWKGKKGTVKIRFPDSR